MNEIQDALLALLPSKRKITPSGWTSVNAICCPHNGENLDTRMRGGFRTGADGSFTWHCFNCNFKAGWSPGKLLSKNTRNLFKWMGMSDNDIGQLNLAALKVKDDQPVMKKPLNFALVERPLPPDCLPIDVWLTEGAQDPELMDVVDYLVNVRGVSWDWYNWHWSAAPGFRDRVILPFYHNGLTVGYTGRKIKDGKPKYLTDAQPGYVFNMDAQGGHKQFVIVTEGQFDAIAIDGVAVMHNEPNDTQCLRINALSREVIVVPDRDRAGAKMIAQAVKQGWSVSMPPWEDHVKDVADAVRCYGRLYTLSTILHYRQRGEINLHLLQRKLLNAKE